MDEDDDAKMREVRRSNNNNNNKKDYDITRVPNKDLITKTLDQKPSAIVMEWKLDVTSRYKVFLLLFKCRRPLFS